MRPCGCSPTTVPSPARPCACARALKSSSTSPTKPTWRRRVHWHGLRLDNRFDGTHETQAPIPVGGTYTYRIEFPDPGVYWYHPHIREDYGQEMGLYGNILVVPADPDYWPPVKREPLVESVILAPSERAVVDVLLEQPGQLTLEHRTPERTYALATIEVSPEPAAAPLAKRFDVLRHNDEWAAERERLAPYFQAP